jgi:subtilisin family serine protease
MSDLVLGNKTSTATLVVGTSTSSSIDTSGDTDWWRVQLFTGYRYQVWLEGYGSGNGTLNDPYLAVYNSDGVLLASSDDIVQYTNRDSYVLVTPSYSGFYFFSAEEFGNNATGTYLITVWQDELASTASAAIAAVNSISALGHIGWQSDFSDWYGVNLTAGVQYQFDLIGSSGDGEGVGLTLDDPWLWLRKSDGTSIIADNDSGLGNNSRIIYTPTVSGLYFLDAQESGVNAYGTYRLIVNSADRVDQLTLGLDKAGSIEFTGNIDKYSIYLTGGIEYGFSITGTTLLDPYLEILRAAGGKVIVSNDDGGVGLNARLIYTPETSGTYYVAARESGNNATGNYIVRVWQLPTISISDATVVEGNAGTTSLVFKITLSTPSADPVTVTVGTTDTSTATSGIDFTSANQIVTIAAGQTSATFTVQVHGDLLFEPTEVFYATLSNPSGGVIGDAKAIGRIVDNDSPYTNLPTDSFLKYQWHLYDSTGINVFPVWSSYTGRGVRVAVFDWGVDANNNDVGPNLLSNLSRNASNLSVGGIPLLASDNHGTSVAGVIAAAANSYETVGVAYNAKIVSILSTGNTTEVSNAFTYAQNFDVLNNSWGYGGAFTSGTNWAFYDDFAKPSFIAAATALKSLADNGRGGLGTVVVQSAGNAYNFGDDTNLHNFQNSRYIITVGATDYAGRSATYSSPGASILVSAPGGNGSDPYNKILTTDRVGAAGYSPDDYTFISGTSFASPLVAGIVALMLEANPRLGYRDIQEILAYTARKTDIQNNTWAYNGAIDWNGGGLHFDALSHDLGYGLVDALAAVRLAETWNPKAKTSANVQELSYSSSPRTRIPDYTSAGGNGKVFDTINVTGGIRVERVEITLDITHSWIGDLSVLLSSPTSKSSSFLIWRPGSGALSAYGSSQDNIHFTLSTVLNWGELSEGNWQLGVFDSAGGSVGTLDKWTIKLIGSQVSNDNTFYYTNEFSETATDQSVRNILSDSGGIDTINASAVTGNLSLNLGPSAVSMIDGHPLTLATGTIIENAIGGDGDDLIQGNNFANVLVGMRGNDTILGGGGNDLINGGAGNDSIDGGDGIDIAEYDSKRSTSTITVGKSNISFTDLLSNSEIDTLKNIERLKFGDVYLAFDLNSNAGVAAKVMGAVFGKASIKNSTDFGYWLAQCDTGLSYADVGQRALDKAGLKTNEQIVSALWKNVVGYAATEVDKAPFIKMLVDGMKPSDLVILAADTTFNTANINLVGLAQTGIEYTPL